MSKKRIEIDFGELEKLCHIQCTEVEISEWFHCSVDTVERRVRDRFGISFAEYYQKKRVGGLVSLRRNLFKLSEKNAAVAIFLAKNWLGMSDKQELEHSGYICKAEDLSDEELVAIIERRRSGGAAKAKTS